VLSFRFLTDSKTIMLGTLSAMYGACRAAGNISMIQARSLRSLLHPIQYCAQHSSGRDVGETSRKVDGPGSFELNASPQQLNNDVQPAIADAIAKLQTRLVELESKVNSAANAEENDKLRARVVDLEARVEDEKAKVEAEKAKVEAEKAKFEAEKAKREEIETSFWGSVASFLAGR